MLNLQITNTGNLKLTADNAARREIADRLQDGQAPFAILSDLMESHSCNGSFTPFDAGDANPFVGLTDAPCVAEAMDHDEDGLATIYGRFWYFADYMIRDELAELKNKGRVFFNRACEVAA